MATLVTLIVFVLMMSFVCGERCMAGKNCKAPHCRCWNDRSIPGKLHRWEAPQIVLITFGNSINKATKHWSMEIMQGLKNPNNCPASATFFIENLNTDPYQVKELYDKDYEIGLSTLNDTIPLDTEEWLDNIGKVKAGLTRAGIPKDALKGFRCAQLYAGGDEMLDVLKKLDIQYDNTCVNRQYLQMNNTLWPYTYDYPEHTPACSIGKTPNKAHNGSWQILMTDLQWNRTHNCPSPSACSPYIKTVEEVFQFFFYNFLNHYNGNRAPFNLYLDPLWLTNPVHNRGTREFLDFLGALSDAWLLTFQQTLDWIHDPQNKEESHTFPPWMCGSKAGRRDNKSSSRVNRARMRLHKVRNELDNGEPQVVKN